MLNSFQHLVVCCYVSAVAQGGGPQAGVPVPIPLREVFAVYPNPVKSQAQIEYSLKAPGLIELAVYDVMGRLVRQLVRSQQPAGVNRAAWDAKTESGERVSSGIYFVKLSAPGLNKTSRFVVVR